MCLGICSDPHVAYFRDYHRAQSKKEKPLELMAVPEDRIRRLPGPQDSDSLAIRIFRLDFISNKTHRVSYKSKDAVLV